MAGAAEIKNRISQYIGLLFGDDGLGAGIQSPELKLRAKTTVLYYWGAGPFMYNCAMLTHHRGLTQFRE